MASGHGNLVSEPLTMAFDAERVLHVTMINLLYPVMEDLLHQVFYVMDLQFEQTPTTSNNSSSPVSLVMKDLKADIEELRIVLKELATIIQEKLANEEEWHSKQEVAEEMHAEMDVAVGMVMPSPITVPPTQPVGLEICVKPPAIMVLTVGHSAPAHKAQTSKPAGWLAGWDLSASHNGVDLGTLSASPPGAEVGLGRFEPSGWLAGWDLSAIHNGADCGKLSASPPGAEVGLGRFSRGPAQQAFWMAGLGPQRQVHWR
uniref:Uncharacterized protein n=1 Tax=Oryza sativa subsp. japonica TaxID=39947 RepID=Q7EYB5_ORYSJ|nr:hypothetical protein [Oryza sativa Japonica Group]BAD01441.1 hypothetical protein [Oryza sativa Japonica Group]